jgi:predicted RNA-binding protein YlqC (UPF0109 family)
MDDSPSAPAAAPQPEKHPEHRQPDLRLMVEQVIKMLVSAPEQVRVEIEDERGTTFLNLHVADADLGKVIGKSGRMAKALRAIVNAAAEKQGKHFSLEIIEDDRQDDFDSDRNSDGDDQDSPADNSAPAEKNFNR